MFYFGSSGEEEKGDEATYDFLAVKFCVFFQKPKTIDSGC